MTENKALNNAGAQVKRRVEDNIIGLLKSTGLLNMISTNTK